MCQRMIGNQLRSKRLLIRYVDQECFEKELKGLARSRELTTKKMSCSNFQTLSSDRYDRLHHHRTHLEIHWTVTQE
jgi:hypothetical protein